MFHRCLFVRINKLVNWLLIKAYLDSTAPIMLDFKLPKKISMHTFPFMHTDFFIIDYKRVSHFPPKKHFFPML